MRRPEGYFQVPNDIHVMSLSAPQLNIYLYICSWRNAYRTQFTYKELMKECRIGSTATIAHALMWLCNLGLLTRNTINGRKSELLVNPRSMWKTLPEI